MKLAPMEIPCSCGKFMVMDSERDWCDYCGRRMFYHEKDRKMQKINKLLGLAMAAGIITFLVYVFVELILKNIF